MYRETGKRGSPPSCALDAPSGPSPTIGNGVQQFDDMNGNSNGALPAPAPDPGTRAHSRPGLSAAAMAGLDQFGQQHQQQMMNPPPYSPYADNGDEVGMKIAADEMKTGGGGGSCDRSKERQWLGA